MKHISTNAVPTKRNHYKSLSLILTILLATGCTKENDSDQIQPALLSPPDTQNLLHQSEIPPPKPVSTAAAEWIFNAPPSSQTPTDLHGWKPAATIQNLTIHDGRLTGETTDDDSYIHIASQKTRDADDLLHSVEITLSVTAGNRISVGFQSADQLDDAQVKREVSNSISEPLIADGALHTYTIQTKYARKLSDLKQIFIVPTDQSGAQFKIESVKLIGLKNYLAENESMLTWQGLEEIYMDALVVRTPHTQTYTLHLPDNPWLDINLGTLTSSPVTFQISASVDGSNPQILSETKVTRSNSWTPIRVDLAGLDQQKVTLTLSTVPKSLNDTESVAVWGQPILRSGSGDTQTDAPDTQSRPKGVILIMADTLRKDHLEAYGYARKTAPNIAKLASEGILFEDCVAQAPWTLVSTASIFTGLYPYTHAVRHFDNRLSNVAQTLAEQYRKAGYATLSLSSVTFTGQQANLHQGFETVHESRSLENIFDPKTAQVFVPRLMPWLDTHKDVPFFVFLHLFDPHNPFKPYSPYDTMWVDPKTDSDQDSRVAALREVIEDPALKIFTMPTENDFEKANVNPEPYFEYVKGHYDGSIRGMDDQIGQLMEKLDDLGLKESTLIAFVSDHGEEFLEHGRTFHGQSTYGELMNVPFILWQYEGLPKGMKITTTVETIDLMPTLLSLSGLEIPEAVQGDDLTPLFTDDQRVQSTNRPAFSEKPLTKPNGFPHGEGSSDAVIVGEWKLIHNLVARDGIPEFELYNHLNDSLDSKNVASQHADIVQQLYEILTQWKIDSKQYALPEDTLGNNEMSQADIERLESIGYMNKNEGE